MTMSAVRMTMTLFVVLRVIVMSVVVHPFVFYDKPNAELNITRRMGEKICRQWPSKAMLVLAEAVRVPALLGTLTLKDSEAIDAASKHCEYRISFPGHAIGRGKGRLSRGITQENVGPGQQTKFLGCARLHANRGSGDLALWRKHALPGACGARRYAIHSGLRNGITLSRFKMERSTQRAKSRNAHSRHALSLGSYTRNSVLHAAVRGKQRVSFL